MPRPLLPPKGIFAPTSMIYNSNLPPPLLQTWLQLRGLAWGRTVTPCIPFKEMAAIIGKSPATLYRHMSQLRNLAALSWRTTGSGSLIVSFSQQASVPPSIEIDTSPLNPGEQQSTLSCLEEQPPILNSQNRESPSHSLLPLPNPNPGMHPQKEYNFLELNTQDNHKLVREGEFEGERQSAGDSADPLEPPSQPVPRSVGSPPIPSLNAEPDLSSDAATLHACPVMVYRHLVHLTPTPAQRRILAAQVRDLPLWQHTLEHWLGHGWNPRNLTGMLELYQRGGPGGCRYCHKTSFPTSQHETPLQHSLAALETLRREQDPSSSSGSAPAHTTD